MTDGRKGSQIHKSAGDIVVHKSAGDIVEERREAIANLCDNEREHHTQRSVGSFVFKGSVGGIGSVPRSFGVLFKILHSDYIYSRCVPGGTFFSTR